MDENGIATNTITPKIEIHITDVSILIANKDLKIKLLNNKKAIEIIKEDITLIFSTYKYISFNSSNFLAPKRCPETLINPLPKPLTGDTSNSKTLFDAEYRTMPTGPTCLTSIELINNAEIHHNESMRKFGTATLKISKKMINLNLKYLRLKGTLVLFER